MYVYVCVCVCVDVHLCVPVCVCVCVCVHASLSLSLSLYIYIYLCVCVNVPVFECLFGYVCPHERVIWKSPKSCNDLSTPTLATTQTNKRTRKLQHTVHSTPPPLPTMFTRYPSSSGLQRLTAVHLKVVLRRHRNKGGYDYGRAMQCRRHSIVCCSPNSCTQPSERANWLYAGTIC